MNTLQEISLHMPLPPSVLWFEQWRPLFRRLLRLPLLRPLRPLARRAAAVAEPAASLTLQSQPARRAVHSARTLTVLSANLWHDWPRHRLLYRRLESLAELIEQEGVDVALLQEVARTPALRVDEWMSRRLGMAHVYSRANGHERAIGFEEGLAIRSRFPLHEPQLCHLGGSRNPFVRRMALAVTLHTPHGNLLAASVHLGLLRRHNVSQLRRLQAWSATVAAGQPMVIGGDFNAPEDSPQIAQAQAWWQDTFRALHPHADGTTHELRWPWGGTLRRHRLDYLFLQGGGQAWRVLEARSVETPHLPHSDHRAVLVRLAPATQQ
ncbi:MAG: endonuclease/exonuclease/phosphatase family protein [Caldilineae bacterium]|nr:MAG: endonuclease/exonuclease/phosphatase family protein [Caldilineae bacterium]